MATTELRLSKKIGRDGKSQVIVKLTINRSSRPCFKSGVFINPNWFKPKPIETKKGLVMGIVAPKKGKYNGDEVNEANEAIANLNVFKSRLEKVCNALEGHVDDLNHDTIEKAFRLTSDIHPDKITYKVIDEKLKAEAEEEKESKTFFDWYKLFMEEKAKSLSEGRVKRLEVMGRMLGRYESYVGQMDEERNNFKLDIDTIDKETLKDFFDYLVNEKTLSEEYPMIFERLVADNPFGKCKRKQVFEDRGHNVMVGLKKVLKTFFVWLNEEGITKNRPFEGIKIGSEKYGTPFYLSLKERNDIADFDIDEKWDSMTDEEKKEYNLSVSIPTIKIQRDIFMFQCLIGCRVSDLMKMTPSSIVNGAIEYIPTKTKGEKPQVVRVPLNNRALALVEKYKNADRKGRLFPFISSQKYNDSIKDVVRICGVDRMVTTLNPVTGEEEQHPIWEMASSHMARRTFIGNLYKQVKDPNLVGSLSGHTEGSKAFVRYRDIDEEMKKDLVSLID